MRNDELFRDLLVDLVTAIDDANLPNANLANFIRRDQALRAVKQVLLATEPEYTAKRAAAPATNQTTEGAS